MDDNNTQNDGTSPNLPHNSGGGNPTPSTGGGRGQGYDNPAGFLGDALSRAQDDDEREIISDVLDQLFDDSAKDAEAVGEEANRISAADSPFGDMELEDSEDDDPQEDGDTITGDSSNLIKEKTDQDKNTGDDPEQQHIGDGTQNIHNPLENEGNIRDTNQQGAPSEQPQQKPQPGDKTTPSSTEDKAPLSDNKPDSQPQSNEGAQKDGEAESDSGKNLEDNKPDADASKHSDKNDEDLLHDDKHHGEDDDDDRDSDDKHDGDDDHKNDDGESKDNPFDSAVPQAHGDNKDKHPGKDENRGKDKDKNKDKDKEDDKKYSDKDAEDNIPTAPLAASPDDKHLGKDGEKPSVNPFAAMPSSKSLKDKLGGENQTEAFTNPFDTPEGELLSGAAFGGIDPMAINDYLNQKKAQQGKGPGGIDLEDPTNTLNSAKEFGRNVSNPGGEQGGEQGGNQGTPMPGKNNKDGSKPENNQVINSPDFDNAGLKTPTRAPKQQQESKNKDNKQSGDKPQGLDGLKGMFNNNSKDTGSSNSSNSISGKMGNKIGCGAAALMLPIILVMMMVLTMCSSASTSNLMANNDGIVGSEEEVNQCQGGEAAEEDGAPRSGSVSSIDGVAVPTTGIFTSGFGARWGTTHDAYDIANSTGTMMYAAHDGTVISAGPADGYGLWVRIQSDENPGFISIYGHNESNLVSVGDRVKAGDPIATMGNRGNSTGPHLHFQIEQDGVPQHPGEWFRQNGIEDFPLNDQINAQVYAGNNKPGGESDGNAGSVSGGSSGGGSSRDSGSSDSGSSSSNGSTGPNERSGQNEDGANTIIVGDSITAMTVPEYHGVGAPAPGVEYQGKDTGKGKMPKLRIDARGSRMFRDEGYNKLKEKINSPGNSNVEVIVIATVSNDPLKESEDKFNEIIKLAHDKGMKVVTLTTSQIDGGAGQTQAYKDLYDGNNEVVKSSDADIIIDWQAETEGKKELFTDFIHPNGEGQKLLVRLMQEAVAKAKAGERGTVGGDGTTTGGGEENSGGMCQCTQENASSYSAASSDAGGAQNPSATQEKYVKLAVALGKKFRLSDDEIIATITAMAAESLIANPASNKWPESKRYTTEYTAAGDHNSVGILQQQVAFGAGATEVGQGGGWLPGSTMKEYMTPAYQLGSFMYKLKNTTDSGKPRHARVQDVQRSWCGGPGSNGYGTSNCGTEYGGNYLKEEPLAQDMFKRLKGSPSATSNDEKEAQKSWDRMKAQLGGAAAPSSGEGSSSSSGSSSGDDSMECDSTGSSRNDDSVNDAKSGKIAKDAVAIALKQKGKPYAWGGIGPDSFDCSGLIYYSYLQAGIAEKHPGYQMPRDTHAQVAAGKSVPRDKIAPGDIIITNNVQHALLYVGNNQVVESQTFGVPVLTRSFDEIQDIVDIRRIVDSDNNLL